MSRIKSTLLALALLAPLAACDAQDQDGETLETRAVEDFEDGMTCDSDAGAFRVILWSDTGDIQVGRNDLVVRLGFHDPSNPDDRGKGIPGAAIDLDAWMAEADGAMTSEPTVEYLGDGQYRIENVVLDQAGVWNFDFEVEIGEHMYDSISLAFEAQ